MAPRAWRPERFALLGILALAASLRFVQLGHDSLWVDEAFSARIAGANFSDLFDQATSADPNPPLYWVLLHGWIAVFGDSEAMVAAGAAGSGLHLLDPRGVGVDVGGLAF